MSTTRQRRVLALARSGHVAILSEPCPEPQAGQLLVRVHASLISAGTELGRFRGKDRAGEPEGPFRAFGYQNAGEVVAVGEGVRNFAPGQRVACMGGDGAQHADWGCVPQNLAVALPDKVSYEEGAFVALAATAMHAVRRGEVVYGENVAVMGLGTVGQLVAQLCRFAGARVLAIDPFAERVAIAQSCGISGATTQLGAEAIARAKRLSEGEGMDCGFICFGGDGTQAVKDLAQMMKQAPDTHRWGRIVIVGGAQVTHSFGAALGNLDLRSAARTGPGYHDAAYEHGADYPAVFVRWTTQAHLRLFARMVAAGELNVKALITDRVELDSAPEACYALMDAPGAHLGTVITYNS